MVSAEVIRDKSQLPSSVEIPDTKFPVFIGRINAEISFSIKGMSGGPIFGLVSGEDGDVNCKVVALQSGWYEKSRIILGCPLPVFGQVIGRYTDELLQRTR